VRSSQAVNPNSMSVSKKPRGIEPQVNENNSSPSKGHAGRTGSMLMKSTGTIKGIKKAERRVKPKTRVSYSGRVLQASKLVKGARVAIESKDGLRTGLLRQNLGGTSWNVLYEDGEEAPHNMEQERFKVIANFPTCGATSKKGTKCLLPPIKGLSHCTHHLTKDEKEQVRARACATESGKASLQTSEATKCKAIVSLGNGTFRGCGKYPLRGRSYCASHKGMEYSRTKNTETKLLDSPESSVKSGGSAKASAGSEPNADLLFSVSPTCADTQKNQEAFRLNVAMLNAAHAVQKKGTIGLQGAKAIFDALLVDSGFPGEYTIKSRKSMVYIRQRYTFTRKADIWLKQEVGAFARKSKKVSRTVVSRSSTPKRIVSQSESEYSELQNNTDTDSTEVFSACPFEHSDPPDEYSLSLFNNLKNVSHLLRMPHSALSWLRRNLLPTDRIVCVPTKYRYPPTFKGEQGYVQHFSMLGLRQRVRNRRRLEVFSVPGSKYLSIKWALNETARMVRGEKSTTKKNSRTPRRKSQRHRSQRNVEHSPLRDIVLNLDEENKEVFANARERFNREFPCWSNICDEGPSSKSLVEDGSTEDGSPEDGSPEVGSKIELKDIEKWLRDIDSTDPELPGKLKNIIDNMSAVERPAVNRHTSQSTT